MIGEFWDYVIDGIFIVWSIADVANDPNDWKNWAALTIDVILAVVPFVPSGAGQVIKVGNKIDNAADIANAINKIDNIQDAQKVTIVGRQMDRVGETAKLIGKTDELFVPWKGYDNYAVGIKKFFHNLISVSHNGFWLFDKLRLGYTVIDIGMHSTLTTRGLWYGIESFVLIMWEYRHILKLLVHNFSEMETSD